MRKGTRRKKGKIKGVNRLGRERERERERTYGIIERTEKRKKERKKEMRKEKEMRKTREENSKKLKAKEVVRWKRQHEVQR